MVDAGGNTNLLSGVVERSGVLWVDNVPLAEGSNWLTLWVTNAAGLSSETNLTVVQSTVQLTLNPVTADLWLPAVPVSGTISDPDNYKVWVNGTNATIDPQVNGSGTYNWSAPSVPLPAGGGATAIQVRAIPLSDNGGNGTGGSGGGPVTFEDLGNPDPNPDIDFESVLDRLSRVVMGKGKWSHDEEEEDGTTIQEWGWYDFMTGGEEHWKQHNPNDPNYKSTESVSLLAPGANSEGAGIAGQYSILVDHNGQQTRTDTNPGGNFWFPYWKGSLKDRTQSDFAEMHPAFLIGGEPEQPTVVSGTASIDATYTGAPEYADDQIGLEGLDGTQGPEGQAAQVVAYSGDTVWLLPVVIAEQQALFYAYIFQADYTKPMIIVNGSTGLHPTMNFGADFCVGQYLDFGIINLPEHESGEVSAEWELPGNYVNRKPDPDCDRYYVRDKTLLKPPTGTINTHCWYVEGIQGAVANVTLFYRTYYDSLEKKWGPIETIKIKGLFNVHRPTTDKATPYQPDGTPTAVITNRQYNVLWGHTINATRLSLSLGDANQHNDMSFSNTITADNFCSGQAGYVQLITGGGADCYPYSKSFDAIGLDGAHGEFQRHTKCSGNYDNRSFLYDAPSVPLRLSEATTSEDVDFSTYLMFKPDAGPGPNIFVPLRLITWELHDEATYNADGTWTPHNSTDTGTTTTTPPDHESTDFPRWTTTY